MNNLNSYHPLISKVRPLTVAVDQAHIAFENNSYKETIFRCREILKKDPNNCDIYCLIGISHLQLKEYVSASFALNKAISLTTIFHSHFHYMMSYHFSNLAICLAKNGEWQKSLNFFNLSIKNYPLNSIAYHNLSVLYKMTGCDDNALNARKKSQELATNKNLFNENKYHFLTKKDYNEIIRIYFKNFKSYKALDKVSQDYRLKKYDAAINTIKKIINYDKREHLNYHIEFSLQYYNRALSYMFLNQIELAISNISKAIDMEPTNARNSLFYRLRGDLWLKKNNYNEALPDFMKAKQLKMVNVDERISFCQSNLAAVNMPMIA